MSGWDVSSTPTWGPQDGPEDTQAFTAPGDSSRDFGTQDFGAQEFGRGGQNPPAGDFPEAGSGFGDAPAGGPPPEFFGQDYGQDQHLDLGPGGFPQRTPGRSLQDLPRRESRGRHGSTPAAGGYGQESAYGQATGSGYPQDTGYGQENVGYGQEAPYGQESAYGQETAGSGYGQDAGYPQDAGYGQENSFGQDNSFGQENSFGQDNSFGQEWGGGADQASPWGADGRDNDGSWGRTAGRSAAPWDERPQSEPGYGDADGFGRQDYGRQPESLGFSAQDYAGQDIPGQQGSGTQGLGTQGLGMQGPPDFGRVDQDTSARNDPALQDFFSPNRGGGGFSGQGPGWSGGEPRDEPMERFTQAPADWANPGRSAAPRTGTGPRPMPRGPRRDAPEPRRGRGMKGFIVIAVVVIVIIAVAVVYFMHKSGGSSPAASNTPTSGAATTPSASKAAGGSGSGTSTGGSGKTTPAYTLSTPSTAGGYAMGQDPSFLKSATATAQQVSTAVTSGGGGTVTGKPVSAAYQIPVDQQVITFVGYEGSFTPAKVATILASLGSDPHTFPAGKYGGTEGCANTTTSPSGAFCVWADSSTLGVTEFFDAQGPETLTAGTEQSNGASDTVKVRDDVEKKAS